MKLVERPNTPSMRTSKWKQSKIARGTYRRTSAVTKGIYKFPRRDPRQWLPTRGIAIYEDSRVPCCAHGRATLNIHGDNKFP